MSQEEYYLFLDESKPNGNNIEHLCLAGIVVSKENYENNVIRKIEELKNEIFSTSSIVLHETEIRRTKVGFEVLRNPEKRKQFWSKMEAVFSEDIITMGAAVNYRKLETYYNADSLKNKYFMVLQIVLENFVHFLECHDAKGHIYIESTDTKSDTELRNVYHDIIANGTLFYTKNVFQNRLLNINFLNKADNNSGLQLADFVPGTLNRKANSLDGRELNSVIVSKLYDGTQSLTERFGFKVIP